jgi:acid phosphatase family membrane protein YuiD
MKELIMSVFSNFTLMTVVAAFLISQVIKVILLRFEEKRWNIWHFFEAGGMPSSHSATVVALALSVALEFGLKSALFAVCLVLALVVMRDAMGIRRAAGKQAEIINKIVDDVYSTKREKVDKLKEILGHDPIEVFAGAGIAILVTLLMYYVYFIR